MPFGTLPIAKPLKKPMNELQNTLSFSVLLWQLLHVFKVKS